MSTHDDDPFGHKASDPTDAFGHARPSLRKEEPPPPVAFSEPAADGSWQPPSSASPYAAPPPFAAAPPYGAPPPHGFAQPYTGAVPPATLAPGLVLGSRGARFGAAVIDTIIVYAIVFLMALAAVAIDGDSDGPTTILMGITIFVGAPLYKALLQCRGGRRNGQTLGKQFCRVRVVRQEQSPMTLGPNALREGVPYLISLVTCGLFGLLDSAWCLWDPGKRCLHDKIASTYVIQA